MDESKPARQDSSESEQEAPASRPTATNVDSANTPRPLTTSERALALALRNRRAAAQSKPEPSPQTPKSAEQEVPARHPTSTNVSSAAIRAQALDRAFAPCNAYPQTHSESQSEPDSQVKKLSWDKSEKEDSAVDLTQEDSNEPPHAQSSNSSVTEVHYHHWHEHHFHQPPLETVEPQLQADQESTSAQEADPQFIHISAQRGPRPRLVRANTEVWSSNDSGPTTSSPIPPNPPSPINPPSQQGRASSGRNSRVSASPQPPQQPLQGPPERPSRPRLVSRRVLAQRVEALEQDAADLLQSAERLESKLNTYINHTLSEREVNIRPPTREPSLPPPDQVERHPREAEPRYLHFERRGRQGTSRRFPRSEPRPTIKREPAAESGSNQEQHFTVQSSEGNRKSWYEQVEEDIANNPHKYEPFEVSSSRSSRRSSPRRFPNSPRRYPRRSSRDISPPPNFPPLSAFSPGSRDQYQARLNSFRPNRQVRVVSPPRSSRGAEGGARGRATSPDSATLDPDSIRISPVRFPSSPPPPSAASRVPPPSPVRAVVPPRPRNSGRTPGVGRTRSSTVTESARTAGRGSTTAPTTPPQGQSHHPELDDTRSAFDDTRNVQRRHFLIAFFMIKRDFPGRPVYFAWDYFCDRLIRTGAFQTEGQIKTAWLSAFREPAIRLFTQLYNGERTDVIAETLGYGADRQSPGHETD